MNKNTFFYHPFISISLRVLFLLTGSVSCLGFTIPEIYHSGPEVCEIYKAQREGEFEKWVEVPAFYDSPKGEKTLIYAYTKKAFDKNLPSVIFFTGGPGLSSRSAEFELPNTNLIFFEQRGLSCSRPATKKLFLNPRYYSSENTAKDALAVVKSYGITSVSSYGQSYGTVPATIFASLFPEYTKGLVIEAAIYEGDKSLWSSDIKKNLLQGLFNGLTPEKQNKVIQLSTNHLLPADWFSKLGNMVLFLNEGVDVFNEFMDNILSMDDESLKTFLVDFYPAEKPEEEFSFGDVTMGMIGCQEISMSDASLSLTLVFSGRTLIYDQNNIDREQRCKPLHLENSVSDHYQALNFPVTVPVFYLLGENDGATDLNQGLDHFNHVAKGKKSLLIMKKGGHLPSLGLIKDNYYCDPAKDSDQCKSLRQNVLMIKIFEGILSTTRVDQALISDFNRGGPLFWSLQEEEGSIIP